MIAVTNIWRSVIDEAKYGLSRDELMDRLFADNIECRPLWHLNHLQKPYAGFQHYKIKKAVEMSRRILTIPSSVTLSADDICEVAKILKDRETTGLPVTKRS